MSLWIKIKMATAVLWSIVFPPEVSLTVPLEKLVLPPGFKAELYVNNIKGARSMTQAVNGVIFVGSRSAGNVYALYDENKNGKIEQSETFTFASSLNSPNGVAVLGDDLYVAEIDRILIFKNAVKKYKSKVKFEVVYNNLPSDSHHGWKYIAFGPDGRLYIPVGAPCNVCVVDDPRYMAIHALDVNTKKMTTVARGVRNSVGFSWHPKSKKLYFTDNGRDWLGDDQPSCELNRVDKEGEHFGFPYCHAGTLLDPEYGKTKKCASYKKPFKNLGAHVAPLGMKFYTGNLFPGEYKNQIFIAEHGSWNRSKKSGYRVSLVTEKNGQVEYKPFIKGWLDEAQDEAWGRPVDILELATGELLVSDDYNGLIYKVSYTSKGKI